VQEFAPGPASSWAEDMTSTTITHRDECDPIACDHSGMLEGILFGRNIARQDLLELIAAAFAAAFRHVANLLSPVQSRVLTYLTSFRNGRRGRFFTGHLPFGIQIWIPYYWNPYYSLMPKWMHGRKTDTENETQCDWVIVSVHFFFPELLMSCPLGISGRGIHHRF